MQNQSPVSQNHYLSKLMLKSSLLLSFAGALLVCSCALNAQSMPPPTAKPSHQAAANSRKPAKITDQQKFVLDVIQSAVGLSEADPQDRLRVLAAASELALPVSPKLSRQLANEGTQVELGIIQSGDTPAVSILSNARVDCTQALNFISGLPVETVVRAEQSIIGAMTNCPKQTLDRARILLDSALEKRIVAPRALLAAMTQTGEKSVWSQQEFVKTMGALPKDSKDAKSDAPLFAQLYATMAPNVEKAAASKTGLQMLDWLAALDESGERNLAITTVTSEMQHSLGADAYAEALRSDITAQTVSQLSGQPIDIEPPEEESVSVMQAMSNRGNVRLDELMNLPPSLRARQAAADAFAAGTGGDRDDANRYFEVAYSALNEVWANRTPEKNVTAVVEEVNEAASHVDAMAALQRAQKLDDSALQAISMLAVARVVEAGQH